MEKTNVAILSYEHDDSREPYYLETLGEDFEITVPPENVLMALCAHHQARQLKEQGVDASILTIGGCAVSNLKIIERINEITQTEISVIADSNSNSVASNIESLTEYDGEFIIMCQQFSRLRTYIHSKYYLKEDEFEIKPWESYVGENEFSDFERDLIGELNSLRHIPLQRKMGEGVLVALAYMNPKDGFTKQIALLRQKVRDEDSEGNIFNKLGLS